MKKDYMNIKLFGTDGIRGKANIFPMTPETVLLIGKAVAQVFIRNRGVIGWKPRMEGKHRIVIGKDTRLSGYMLESALQAGICSMGVDVLLVGPMPTPAIAHLTKSLNADAGIVISASHNPSEDNGIKIFGSDGYKLPDTLEQEIEQLVLTSNINCEHIQGSLIGKAFRVEEAYGRYIEFAKASISSESLSGLKIVVDCANGAAYRIAPKVFSELGAIVIAINDSPNGLNINCNGGATMPGKLSLAVLKHKADIGIALDGDADRVIFSDELGEIIDGDYVLTYSALAMIEKKQLRRNTLVVTEYSNLSVDETLKGKGATVVRTKNGDKRVIEEMKNNGYNLGGEFSGHIIFGDYATTGDGIISALQLLRILKEKRQKASAIRKIMAKYPQKIINVRVKEKKELQLLNADKLIKKHQSSPAFAGRILVRYSGTENLCRIMVEAKTDRMADRLSSEIARSIKSEIGA